MDLGNVHFTLSGNYVKILHTRLVILFTRWGKKKKPYATEYSNSAFFTLNNFLLTLMFLLCVSDPGESKN